MFNKILRDVRRPIRKPIDKYIAREVAKFTAHDRARLEKVEEELAKTRTDLANAETKVLKSEEFQQHFTTMLRERIFLPPSPVVGEDAPYMVYSTCSVADVAHPEFARLCSKLGYPLRFHRKFWEWAYIVHHLERLGALLPGKKGLVFGVGEERLPALFAKNGCSIVATDAPPEIGERAGWSATAQYSYSVDQLRCSDIIPDNDFKKYVTFKYCDMNVIDKSLREFDFNWSSCCFEHLGDLEKGTQFVINSMDTLKPGGVSVHTTEYNLSSNADTIESGATVIYRRRDIESLIQQLRDLGYIVSPFVPAPHTHPIDFHIDAPPYHHDPHLKLRLANYAATSVGLWIVKPN
jgi:hypothetical protein